MGDPGPAPSDLDQSQPGWYVALAAPRSSTKPPYFAWIDPTRIYAFKEAFTVCVEDLIHPFMSDPIDLVAGIDGTGFILGAAIAQRLNLGFLAVRKASHLCVETDSISYTDYQKKEKAIEIRKYPFPPGTRVLIVDQWIETGGTMKAACQLIEDHQGTVAGISAICIEETPGGLELKSKCKYSVAPITADVQNQINNKGLESFQRFKE